jgi:hypothetical protein
MTALGESSDGYAGARAHALAQLAQGHTNEAYEGLRRSLAGTVDLEGINDLAVIAHQLGRSEEAEALLRAVTAIDPDRRDAAENLAVLTQQSGPGGRPEDTSADVRLGQLAATLGWLVQAEQQRVERDGSFQTDVLAGMRRIHANELWHRRRLRELRTTPEYELAYTDPDPLISVVIPTYNRLDLLRSRAIPSILAQKYRNFEIVIVGDHADFGAEEVTAGFHGAPISFFNLSIRGPYYEDHNRAWLSSGTPPFNEALSRARGPWIAPFADDDEMRPHHLQLLVDAAQARRLEFVYGRSQMHHADSGNRVIGVFPPKQGEIVFQAALMHGHLKMFELELADADFRVPNDWGAVDRMIRAGVRFGMIDDVLIDYYPSFSR